MRIKHPTLTLIPTGAIALALLLSGCGGSSDSSQAAPAQGGVTATSAPDASQSPGTGQDPNGGAGTDRTAQRDEFRTCLAEHGITLPSRAPGTDAAPSIDPNGAPGGFGQGGGPGAGFAPEGVDAQKFQAAMQACGGPGGGPGGMNGGARPDSAAFQAYTSCLADHGVKVPSAGARPNLNSADPTVASAMKTCAPLRPKLTGRPTPASTSS